MAQTRNWAGDFFEECSASLLGAVRHELDGTKKVCPDLSLPRTPGVYFENKSIGRNNASIVYDHRLHKDVAWTAERGARLFYCLWRHKAACAHVKLLSELRAELARTAYEVVIVPLDALVRLCDPARKRVINTKPARRGAGYGGKGYKEGWSIPMKRLRDCCPLKLSHPGVSAYGYATGRLDVYYTHEAAEVLQ